MASREFIYSKLDGSASKPATLTTVMGVAGKRLISGNGPFTLTKDGDSVVSDAARMVTLRKLRRRLSTGGVGPTYRVRDHKDDVIFRVRETEPAIRVINTNGNDKADVYWSTIIATFPQYHPRFAGAYVCKSILGSGGNPSQHSYGNAVDIFFDSFAHQEDATDWVVAHADELHIEHAISGRRIWTRGQGWSYYGGEYHSHLHVDFNPSFSGSCGVRGLAPAA